PRYDPTASALFRPGAPDAGPGCGWVDGRAAAGRTALCLDPRQQHTSGRHRPAHRHYPRRGISLAFRPCGIALSELPLSRRGHDSMTSKIRLTSFPGGSILEIAIRFAGLHG